METIYIEQLVRNLVARFEHIGPEKIEVLKLKFVEAVKKLKLK